MTQTDEAAFSSVLFESSLNSVPLIARGKVRDLYAVGDDHLLMVATDRLSAFDVVLPDPIPGKGAMLTALSNFWFARFRDRVPNHLSNLRLEDVLADPAERAQVAGRAVIVRKLKPLMVEAVVRGYLIGSGWKEYQASGGVCGITLPSGLRQADRLPHALFTPSTKAAAGAHDENIDFATAERLLGTHHATEVRRLALALYTEAATYAQARGIIIADTKFEFGLNEAGDVCLMPAKVLPVSSTSS